MSGTPWVAMRARNDMPLVERTLAALAGQKAAHRLLVLDNASKDGTREAAAQYADKLIDIPEGAYVPGKVLNLAMRETDGEFVVFLNSDCEPEDPDWLGRLLAGMDDPAIAAAFGRQDPRPDCAPLMAKDTLMTFGNGARQARWRHCFSMAASCVRRSVWDAMPFSETLRYSEDIDWTWRARQAGHRIRYVADSAVMHSHNYTLAQLKKRQYGEGFADAEIFEWEPSRMGLLRFSILPWGRLVLSDAAWCLRRLKLGAIFASPVVRAVMAAGRRRGFLDGLAEKAAKGAAARDAVRDAAPTQFAAQGSADFNIRLGAALEKIAGSIKEASGGALLGLVLCGGYGRGEGSVIVGGDGKEYGWNDVDLLPVAAPGRLDDLKRALDRRGGALERDFAAEFRADLDIGRPIEEAAIRKLPPVLLWLETGRGHRVIGGDADLFARNLSFDPRNRPAVIEAEKLLLNRGAGLLMACCKAAGRTIAAYDCSDEAFVRRNAAKAALSLGDALLIAAGRYETPVSAKASAFAASETEIRGLLGGDAGAFGKLAEAYAFGIAFKNAPGDFTVEPAPARLAELARFWLASFGAAEAARAGEPWRGPAAFAASRRIVEIDAHRGLRALARNFVHNARLGKLSFLYPRESLFREIPLLLQEAAGGGLPGQDRVEAFIALWKRYN